MQLKNKNKQNKINHSFDVDVYDTRRGMKNAQQRERRATIYNKKKMELVVTVMVLYVALSNCTLKLSHPRLRPLPAAIRGCVLCRSKPSLFRP